MQRMLIRIVQCPELYPVFSSQRRLVPNYQEHLRNWNARHAQVRMLIRSVSSHRVLSKLTTCWAAGDIWQKLCSLYLKRTAKNVFTPQGKFYDYKMARLDDISSHIHYVY